MLRRVASLEFSPAFQSRVGSEKGSRRIATPEIEFNSTVATRRGNTFDAVPALKRRAKFIPTLRVEESTTMSDFRIIQGSIGGSVETQDFVDALSSTRDPLDQGKNYFGGNEPVMVTRAPGRLDVMGGIADYSGSLVLQLPLAYATHVAIQKVDSTDLRVLSLGGSEQRYFEIELAELLSNNSPIDYDEALRRFAESSNQWAAHVIGAFIVLMHERNFRSERGANILIKSSVPEGKGVSSSAAIEVASMQAIAASFEINLAPTELATLCQKVENLVAGAPSGIMDQMTSACGEENRLLELLCQPDVLLGSLALPEELSLWGIDSGVRHSVGGADYGTVRTAAFMGYRIIADLAQLPVSHNEIAGKVHITDSKWQGYLANITPDEFADNYEQLLPNQIRGDAFLDRYHGITDKVTSVNPATVYPVRQATRHPIYENDRVTSFASILKNWRGLEQAPQLGTLMFESHQSYSDCGLGSEATDLIVKLVKESLDGGLFGARITGGGSGGTVAVLGRVTAGPVIEKVRRLFQKQTGYEPLIISGSSPGAAIFDYLKLEKPTTATNFSAV